MKDSDFSFTIGVIALLIIMKVASEQGGILIETLILAGIVIQAFFSSIVSFLIIMEKQTINEISSG